MPSFSRDHFLRSSLEGEPHHYPTPPDAAPRQRMPVFGHAPSSYHPGNSYAPHSPWDRPRGLPRGPPRGPPRGAPRGSPHGSPYYPPSDVPMGSHRGSPRVSPRASPRYSPRASLEVDAPEDIILDVSTPDVADKTPKAASKETSPKTEPKDDASKQEPKQNASKNEPKKTVIDDMPQDIPSGSAIQTYHNNGSTLRLLSAVDDPPYRSSVTPFHSSRAIPLPRPHSKLVALCMNNEVGSAQNRSLYTTFRPTPVEPSYQRPLSRTPSVLDNIPDLPPPSQDGGSFTPKRPASPASQSPRRPWTPSRGSVDLKRPAATAKPYEPAEINGSPRPGTPSSQYGGSPKRPLPPAPLFAGGRPVSASSKQNLAQETVVPIEDPGDDVFAPDEKRPTLETKHSFASDSTFTDDLYSKEKFEQYGPAPEGRQVRRGARQAQMAKKEVRLINGELVLECKIPTILYSFLPFKNSVEFTHMRYTAVTCDPDDFVSRGYKLRQNIGNVRETELLICITMYNEDEIAFTRTMHAVMKNIAHFCSRSKSRTWGEDGWEKIVVCIISDGRAKVHPRTLDALAAMGVYQDGIAKNSVNQKQVSAHVYEYTTQVSLDPDLKFKGREKGIMPCQLIFCLKEQNQKKLNSHRWLFNAFGKALNPNVCILLDVGTRPGDTSLYHLWKVFDTDSNVAGAAGEVRAGKGKAWTGLLNPLVASQNFEYKMSNILDKPIESVFGYITVLPGALSAYRYYALQNDSTGHGPLSQYFKGEKLHGSGADVFTANMYLAEDRILCWELVAKRSERWVLKYVKNAIGETDVPNSVPEFISQRRRWLNGAFFAAVYSLLHFRQIWQTDHTMPRKVLLHIEFVYQFITLIFTFFSLANFYLTFYFIAGSLGDPTVDPFGHNVGEVIFVILRYSCILLICMQFIISMGNRPQGAKKMYIFSMAFYAVIMVYTIFAALYIVIRQLTSGDGANGPIAQRSMHVIGNNTFTNVIVSTFSTIGLYFFMSFLYFDPWHMFTSSAQYFALLPSYICTLQVYAFCNAHDVTWGTKGDNLQSTDLGAAVGNKNNVVEMEMPSEQLDIDSGYDEALRNLRDKLDVPAAPLSEYQQHEDYYRAVRTYVVVVWLSANSILAMAVSEAYSGADVSDNSYLKFILWSVAVLALFRAIGSSVFRIIGLVQLVAEGQVKWSVQKDKWSGSGSSAGGGGLSLADGGSWISSKLSKMAPSSMGSTVGK